MALSTTTHSHDLLVSLSACAFTLPGILPPASCLLLDLRTRTAIHLHLEQGILAPLVGGCPLRPSASRVFLALLQAYPQYCSYQQLFTMLYASVEERHRPVWNPAIGLRPVRRALSSLSPALQYFGLAVIALRTHGYLLTSATPLTEDFPEARFLPVTNARPSLPGSEQLRQMWGERRSDQMPLRHTPGEPLKGQMHEFA